MAAVEPGNSALVDRPERMRGFRDGRLEFDSDRADKCLSKFRNLLDNQSCIAIGSTVASIGIPACTKALTGTVASGAACHLDRRECRDGLRCRLKDKSTCYGVCQKDSEPKRLGEGEDCARSDAICDPDRDLVCARQSKNGERRCREEHSLSKGDFCENNLLCGPGLVCSDEACEEFSVVGEGKSCDSLRRFCAPGTICRGIRAGEMGTCRPFAKAGESCRADLHCRRGNYCKLPDGGGEGTCKKLDQAGDECVEGSCASGVECLPLRTGRLVCQFERKDACELPG